MRSGKPTPEAAAVAPPATLSGSSTGKGRPTPSRKQAEAQRKQTLKVPTDPKEAKKAAKKRAAAERAAARAALASGDERALPARDAGPVRAFVRDFVDGRWAAAELFLPMAVVVLVLGFLPATRLQALASSLWLILTIFMIIDTVLLLTKLNRELRRRWPDKADRKGARFYATMRVLQLRKLRLPPPKVRPGGRPAKTKKGKGKESGQEVPKEVLKEVPKD